MRGLWNARLRHGRGHFGLPMHRIGISALFPGKSCLIFCLFPLACHVSAHSKRLMPDGKDATLELKILFAFEDPVLLKIPVITHVPEIKLLSASLQNREESILLASICNKGDQDLLDEVEFLATIGDLALDKISRKQIKFDETVSLSFTIPEDMKITRDTRFNLTARKVNHPIHEWTFTNQPITLPAPP